MLTNSLGASADVLPALGLLQHDVRILPAEVSVLIDAPIVDCIFVDARRDLPNTKAFTKLITTTGVSTPIVVITTEGGLSAINSDWQIADVMLDTAGPAEVDARIRIVIGKDALTQLAKNPSLKEIRSGEVVIDEDSYTAKIKGRTLDLALKEFELLEFLVRNSGRVLTRTQLIDRVWGSDYFGDTKTLDVHVKRLRAKIEKDPANPVYIQTIRGLGYKFEN